MRDKWGGGQSYAKSIQTQFINAEERMSLKTLHMKESIHTSKSMQGRRLANKIPYMPIVNIQDPCIRMLEHKYKNMYIHRHGSQNKWFIIENAMYNWLGIQRVERVVQGSWFGVLRNCVRTTGGDRSAPSWKEIRERWMSKEGNKGCVWGCERSRHAQALYNHKTNQTRLKRFWADNPNYGWLKGLPCLGHV